MKLIKISTDLELTVHDFPTGTHSEQNDYLRGLILLLLMLQQSMEIPFL